MGFHVVSTPVFIKLFYFFGYLLICFFLVLFVNYGPLLGQKKLLKNSNVEITNFCETYLLKK